MVNAVVRSAAKPIFADVDSATFGSAVGTISHHISSKTKMIVAEHSFGTFCDIEPISIFTKKESIFFPEDSALTLGSKTKGVTVGNFGDGALFSTDHTRPLVS